MQAANEPSSQWIPVQDLAQHFEARFPRTPVKMDFDFPKAHTLKDSHLTVYSSATKQGTTILGVISSSNLTDQVLQNESFKNLFYQSLVKWVFHHPKAFQQQQAYHPKKTSWQGSPGLEFTFTYQEHGEPRTLSGLAVLKNQRLYILFEIAASSQNTSTFRPFVDSFHLMS